MSWPIRKVQRQEVRSGGSIALGHREAYSRTTTRIEVHLFPLVVLVVLVVVVLWWAL